MESAGQDEDLQDDGEFLVWYTDIVENYPHIFVHYLSDHAQLQWFHRTYTGHTNILNFFKHFMHGAVHRLNLPVPARNRRVPLQSLTITKFNLDMTASIQPALADVHTPPNSVIICPARISKTVDIFAGGDGPRVWTTPDSAGHKDGLGDEETVSTHTVETSGAVEFGEDTYDGTPGRRNRPITLKIGYRGCLKYPLSFSIQSIAYCGNIPCCRNLLPEFNKCDSMHD